MRRIILLLIVIVVIGLIAWGIWFFAFSKNPNSNVPPSGTTGSLPSTSPSIPARIQSKTQSGESVYVQNISSPQNSNVANNFLGQIQNANQIALGGTVIASSYALQIWGDANKGGEALLESTSSAGWSLISLGGGEWSVLGLVQVGVPVSAAEQLVAGLNNGGSPSSTNPPVTIPPGATLSLGTANGTVTMNNFYKTALYIDQDEQAVIIQQTSNYSIVYNIPSSSFTLTIVGAPFEAARQVAESNFLTTLGISKADACKLGVTINEPYSANPNPADEGLKLSFCPSGTI